MCQEPLLPLKSPCPLRNVGGLTGFQWLSGFGHPSECVGPGILLTARCPLPPAAAALRWVCMPGQAGLMQHSSGHLHCCFQCGGGCGAPPGRAAFRTGMDWCAKPHPTRWCSGPKDPPGLWCTEPQLPSLTGPIWSSAQALGVLLPLQLAREDQRGACPGFQDNERMRIPQHFSTTPPFCWVGSPFR